jgi:hypothetical protein
VGEYGAAGLLLTHARFDSVEAGVGLFVRLRFYRTFHAETQRN